VVYLLPGGVLGIVSAPFAGRVVSRFGGLPTLLAGALSGVAGFVLLAFLRGAPWVVVLAGLLTQLAVTLAYAALPALVVQAVPSGENGVANAVNSIARSFGQALGSTIAVTILAATLDPATRLPKAVAFTLVALVGAAASLAVVVAAVAGLGLERRSGHRRRPDPLSDVEQATAGASEWSPVSGIQ
jgi:MFS family permease